MTYLVRHADAEWADDETGGLSAKGRQDAERLAEALAGSEADTIYSSPFRRALETVQPLARRLGLPICEVADFRERHLGAGRFDNFTAAVRATWDDFFFAHPGGESNAAAQQRVVAAYERLLALHPRGRILISTHGNALALLLKHYQPSVGFDFWNALSRPDVYRLSLHASGGARIERVWE